LTNSYNTGFAFTPTLPFVLKIKNIKKTLGWGTIDGFNISSITFDNVPQEAIVKASQKFNENVVSFMC
jgi:hypothetical protein